MDWLFYGKVGGAWMRGPRTFSFLVRLLPQRRLSMTTGPTFTVGAAIEFGLVENLSGKVEYDFYDFGSKTYSFNAITLVSVKSYLHTLTVGLNYRFNWSGGPKP